MADFGPPVAQNVNINPNQGIQTLSGLLGIQQRQQQLQIQSQELQRSQVQTQQDLGVNQFFSQWSPGDHHGDDGTVDIDSAHGSDAYQNLPGVARIAVDTKLNAIKGQQLDNKTKLAQLNGDVVGQFGKLAQSLSQSDDPDFIKSQLAAFAQQGPDQARVAQIYGPALQKVPPERLKTALTVMGAQAQDVSAQQAQTNPAVTPISTGGQTKVYNVDKATGLKPGQQPAQSLTNTLAPTVVYDPVTKAPVVIGGGSGGGGGGPSNGNAPPNTMHPYPGMQGDIEGYRGEVQSTRQAADQAPLAHNINQQILRLSADSKTGPGSDVWQHVIGAVGAPFGLSPSASYQEVGKFLEKNAISNMQSMGGPPSDARLSAASAANGSTSFSPTALQAVTKFNDATTSALSQYRQGIDNYIGTRNPDYTKLPDFKKEWSKNFDVNVFRAENAVNSGDTKELAALKQELGPDGLKALAQKRKNLQALSQGELPQ